MPSTPSPPPAPVATRRDHFLEAHGERWNDPYHWLRDRAYPTVSDPEVLAYLEAENAYLNAMLGPFAALRAELLEELKARLVPDEADVPWRLGGYTYQSRYDHGAQYPRHLRTPVAGGDEQLLLDEGALAELHEFLDVRSFSPSPSGRLLAYSADFDGSERYQIHLRDADTGRALPDVVPDTSGVIVWGSDDKTVLYARLDAELRPSRIFRHVLGTPVADDELLYEERDPSFWTSLGETLDRRYAVIKTATKVTSELHLLDLSASHATPRCIVARRTGHECDVVHHEGKLFLRTNDQGADFRVVSADVTDPSAERWTEVLPHVPGRYAMRLMAFERHLVVLEREAGLPQVRVLEFDTGEQHRIEFPDAAYTVSPKDNAEYRSSTLRVTYQSLVTPPTVLDYDMKTRTRAVRKVQSIPTGYDASAYVSERIMAPARDGLDVPVSIVRHKSTPLCAETPLVLYAYGAYGITVDPSFSTHRLSLLDRGFVYAIAHPRGGSDLGRQWYDDGKLDKKQNTFDDTIAVGRHLIAEGYTGRGQITVVGGSAGGMLVGAVINQAPELFRAAVAQVPFVDCLATMLDATLPLTPPEYTEWGNPSESIDAFRTIRAYSPYDNVRPQRYPHLLVTAGIADPRVTYWEPAKWVAKLRHEKRDENLLLLHTNMNAGHRGASGRYDALEELALQYTFMLAVHDRAHTP